MNISHVVQGFERASIDPGRSCQSCGSTFSRQEIRFDGAAVGLRCDSCHADALTCKPCLPSRDDDE
jgi:hypothetical protein